MDSDGEREDDEERQNNLFLSTQQETYSCTACPGDGDEVDSPMERIWCPRASMVICVGLGSKWSYAIGSFM